MSVSPVVYAVLASIANIIGALLVTSGPLRKPRMLDALLAFSAAFLIGIALLDLVPQSLAAGGASAAWLVLVGYVLVHFSQHVLVPHFHFGEEVHAVTARVSVSALIGLLLHTFVDGMAIASGYHVSPRLGALVAIAIALHKVPEGVAIASLFVKAGWSARAALGAAMALGIATVVGAMLTLSLDALQSVGLGLAAGVTLYVGASNLVPEFQGKRDILLPIAFLLGLLTLVVARGITVS
ncbi:MAG TPA: ZIP family metal transporter [Gemmatimonadaceae bacterium]|nr:ZIP family metal transporter [Gemmatimonadaceae bacterium]